MSDIELIHKEVFEHLLKYRKRDESLFFVPRKRNNKNRLDKGYYFIGNEEYLHISFWDGSDKNEKIHNIGFVIAEEEGKYKSYIEISSRDNDSKAQLLRKLVQILNKFSTLEFKEVKINKWSADYEGNNYFLNLESFINVEKRIIDNFLKSINTDEIKFLDESFHKKYVDPLILKEEIKKKKEGSVEVEKNTYTMHLYHNKLQNKIEEYLKNHENRYENILLEKDRVDIKGKTLEGKWHYYEVKTCKSKLAIRQALGQLLEYANYPENNRAEKLYIVSDEKPQENDVKYLNYLRNKYNLPIYYRYYDFNEEMLSKEY